MMNPRAVKLIAGTLLLLGGCHGPLANAPSRWHADHASAIAVPPIEFHYDHGVLAGSYPDGVETVSVRFEDVCAQLGHVCLCGAGGFQVARNVVDALRHDDDPLERGDFMLISARDHTVSDVIAMVLGCDRRADAGRSQYFIDDSIKAPPREYNYYIAYPPTQEAVHVLYRKHLLMGHDEMNSLWKIELAFEDDPGSVSASDVDRYSQAMRKMVRDVLFDRVPGLITVEPMAYSDFQARLDAVRKTDEHQSHAEEH